MIAAGFKRHGVSVTVISKPPKIEVVPGTDLAVFIGVKGRKVRDACVAVAVPYLMIDKGYFNRSRHHRFALNGFTPCYLGSGHADARRTDRLGIKPYTAQALDARYVAFVGFDDKYAAFHGLDAAAAYANRVHARIKSIITGTRLQLRIRDRAERSKIPFNILLPQCHCIVTHGSIAGVEAHLGRVPVVSLGQRAANVMHDLSNDRLEDVVNPKLPPSDLLDRRLAELSWCQFTTEEIERGLAWEIIAPQYKRL